MIACIDWYFHPLFKSLLLAVLGLKRAVLFFCLFDLVSVFHSSVLGLG